MISKKHKGNDGEPRPLQETERNQSPLRHPQKNFNWNNHNTDNDSNNKNDNQQQKQSPLQSQLSQHSQPQEQSVQQLDLQTTINETSPPTTTTTTTTTTYTNNSLMNPIISEIQKISKRDLVRDGDIQNVAMVTEKSRTVQSMPISLISNYFPIVISNNKTLQYRIDFDPPQVATDKRRSLLKEFISKNNFTNTFYDGDSILYSPINITTNPQSINGVQISIKMVKQVNHKDKSSAQFFNTITKTNIRKMGFSIIGRNYYSSFGKINFNEHCLEVWKGFSTSVVSTENGTMLLADTSSKVIRSQTVLDRMSSLRFDEDRCYDEIVGSIVLTRYNNKTYRISGISWSRRVDDIMEGKTTFFQYYQRNYPNHGITDYNQPLLKSEIKLRGVKQTIYLIPELTFLTGLSDHMRKQFKIMKDIAEHSNIEPYKRYETLRNFVSNMNDDQNVSKSLEPLGISYQSALKVDGFVLTAPKNLPNNNRDRLNRIKWVFIAEEFEYHKRECLMNLDNFIKETGLQKPEIYLSNSRDNNPLQYSNLMKKAMKENRDIQLFLILIPQNQEIYREIKRKALVELKVLTQCVFPRTFYKGRAVISKLKQQVIAKLGFAPWSLNQEIFKSGSGGVVPKKTMIIGVDVGHNSDMRSHSVVGFVATIDDKFQKYFSRSFVQNRAGKEIIDSLEEATREAMAKYFQYNYCLPELVIVYRDGVGDGMLDLVNRTEITAMKRGFDKTPSSWGLKPKLMYVIVKKNTSARFFTNERDIKNPPPGTLVDSKITHPGWYDFFLVSQVTFRGSVNPTHYHVLLDEQKIPADLFQLFTFQMCHLYFNFEKSVRVPATCQYAHRMAFLIGRTVCGEASHQLSDKLFYL
ncbi:hypothetical protein ACTA71_000473 [Dictyostelium dimigraforme]